MKILDLQLKTSNLSELTDFYGGILGFPVLELSGETVRFQAGTTSIGFSPSQTASPVTYHFAFDIPESQLDDAKAWLDLRVRLLTDENGGDTFHFKDWDAHSLYFYDPTGNIVELIARHALPNASDTSFSAASIVNVSEIGVVVDDVEAQVVELQKATGVTPYRQAVHPEFTPLGDEGGLLIVVKDGRSWFPVKDMPAQPSPVTVVVQANDQIYALRFNSSNL